jgi:hypothetical protein
MLRCPVCQFENDEFAVLCGRCKAFLQNRIPNLDLFDTAWGILEKPRSTFRQIAVADHKNFSFFLFGLFGISLSFAGLWYFRLGDRFSNLLDLIIKGLLAGPILGLAICIPLVVVFHLASIIVGGKAALRTSLGLIAYSLTPVALSLFFVLPIELLTFGMYLFTSNPHPYIVKPLSYVVLVGLDGVVSLWSILLVVVGGTIAHGLPVVRSVAVVVVTVVVFGVALVLASPMIVGAFSS